MTPTRAKTCGPDAGRARPPVVAAGRRPSRRASLAGVPGEMTRTASLATRFHDGDPDALRDLYGDYGRSVYGVAYRALGNRALAEEAVQQTFLQAWRAAATVDPTREIGPWLFTIARRVAVDVFRKESRRAHGDFDELADNDPAVVTWTAAIEGMSETWQIRTAVDHLPADEREVVRLQHFDGLTHVEIAARLDVPVGTVKSRSFRAHKRLASTLGHLQEVTP